MAVVWIPAAYAAAGIGTARLVVRLARRHSGSTFSRRGLWVLGGLWFFTLALLGGFVAVQWVRRLAGRIAG